MITSNSSFRILPIAGIFGLILGIMANIIVTSNNISSIDQKLIQIYQKAEQTKTYTPNQEVDLIALADTVIIDDKIHDKVYNIIYQKDNSYFTLKNFPQNHKICNTKAIISESEQDNYIIKVTSIKHICDNNNLIVKIN